MIGALTTNVRDHEYDTVDTVTADIMDLNLISLESSEMNSLSFILTHTSHH